MTPIVVFRRIIQFRKRAAAGKCEGRKRIAELRPDIVAEAKRLRRKCPPSGPTGQNELIA
jgi:hypothetical protein